VVPLMYLSRVMRNRCCCRPSRILIGFRKIVASGNLLELLYLTSRPAFPRSVMEVPQIPLCRLATDSHLRAFLLPKPRSWRGQFSPSVHVSAILSFHEYLALASTFSIGKAIQATITGAVDPRPQIIVFFVWDLRIRFGKIPSGPCSPPPFYW